jgi:hypothetical protein
MSEVVMKIEKKVWAEPVVEQLDIESTLGGAFDLLKESFAVKSGGTTFGMGSIPG